MDNINEKTEQIILNTAITLFTAKGYNGITMQMIADKSNINKALIHYYYRNKQSLFEKVFVEIGQDFIQMLVPVFEKETLLTEKINHLIRNIIIYGEKKPDFIYFLITELKRDNSLTIKLEALLSAHLKKGLLNFYRLVNESVETRQIKQIHPRQLLEIIFTVCFTGVVNKYFFDGLLGTVKNKPLSTEEKIKQKTRQILGMIL